MDLTGIREINEQVEREALFIHDLLAEIRKRIVGQDTLVERVLVALLADGHVLLEGVPGLAKTLTISILSQAVGLSFSRIQFTPDLLPTDITGSSIYNPSLGEFQFVEGPIFGNIVLADEINRSSPRTQSALLEAMGEGQERGGCHQVAGIFGKTGNRDAHPPRRHLRNDDDEDRQQAQRGDEAGKVIDGVKRPSHGVLGDCVRHALPPGSGARQTGARQS